MRAIGASSHSNSPVLRPHQEPQPDTAEGGGQREDRALPPVMWTDLPNTTHTWIQSVLPGLPAWALQTKQEAPGHVPNSQDSPRFAESYPTASPPLQLKGTSQLLAQPSAGHAAQGCSLPNPPKHPQPTAETLASSTSLRCLEPAQLK